MPRMSILAEMRTRARFAVAPILCTALMAYYGYHAIEGERGLKVFIFGHVAAYQQRIG